METKDRIKKAIKFLIDKGVAKNQKELGEILGYENESYFSQLVNNKVALSNDFVFKLQEFIPNINTRWLLYDEGDMFGTNGADLNKIPLIPYTASAGCLSGVSEGVTISECEMINSPIKDVTVAIQVLGDSMLPEFVPGETLLLRKINERLFIEWGTCYVIDTENGVVLKRIMPGSTDDTITCVSLNDKYLPFEIRRCDIIGFYKIVMTMRKKSM